MLQKHAYHGEFFKGDYLLLNIKSNIFSGKKIALDISPSKHILAIDKVYPTYIDVLSNLKMPVWKIEASAHQNKHWLLGLLFQNIDLESKLLSDPQFHFYFWEYSKGYEGKSRNITKELIDGQYVLSKRKFTKENIDADFRANVNNGTYFSIYNRLDK